MNDSCSRIKRTRDHIKRNGRIRHKNRMFSLKIHKGGKNRNLIICVSVIVKTTERPTCSGINEPARIALYLRERSVLSPGSETWEEFEAEIGRVGARGTDKGDRDSRVRQFPYPVSAKEARSREEKEVERRGAEGGGRRKGDEGWSETERTARGAERSERSRSEWPLSSRVAGCVSDGRFIWRNPVYETLDARTTHTYACMRAFYSAGILREWTGNGPVWMLLELD